jgi:hypothetical protein
MKRLLVFIFLIVGFAATAQKPNLPGKNATPTQFRELVADSLGLPTDTFSVPSHYNMRARPWIAGHGDSLYIWSVAQQKWVLVTGAVGGGSDGNNYTDSIKFGGNTLSLFRHGLSTLSASFDSTKWHTLGYLDTRFAPIVHGHTTTDISGLSTAILNTFHGGTGIDVNNSTGVISWTGSSSGVASINGLTASTQTFATGTSGTDFNIGSAGTAHTFNIPTASATKRGLLSTTDWSSFNAKEDASNKSTSTSLGTSNTLYPSQNAVKTYVDNAVAGVGTPSLTQYRLAVGNASNQISTAAAITGSRAVVSDANGVPTHSATTATQIGYLSTTTSDVQTQINGREVTFTETTQEFTGATSMSITLSNTPKAGKAEMYYLNGVVIKSSNISRTGSTVTLSGFTRESSDVITAKYSY